MKYKHRQIKTEKANKYSFWAYCIKDNGEHAGQALAYGNTKKQAICEMKRLIDRAIHYNGY